MESSQTSNSTFNRTPGTVDQGKDFERLMCLFTCLELSLRSDVDDFEITKDDDRFGNFDDLVVTVTYKNGIVKKDALQLKHVENSDKQLNVKDLCETKGRFSVQKYCSAAGNIPDGFTCTLHTNIKSNLGDVELALQQKDVNKTKVNVQIFKGQNRVGNVYTFQVDRSKNLDVENGEVEAYENFFKKFRLLTDQVNLEELNTKTTKKAKEIFGQANSLEGFKSFIYKWSSKTGNLLKLNKSLVVSKIVESAVSPYIKTISETKGPHNDAIRRAILKFGVTSFSTTNDFVDKIWVDNRSDQDVKNAGGKYFLLNGLEDEEELGDDQYTKIKWYMGESPLIVEMKKESEKAIFSAIDLIVKHKLTKRPLLLLNCDGEQEVPSDSHFRNLRDLKEIDVSLYNKILAEFQLFIRGRQCKLETIVVAEQVAESISTDFLVQLAKNECRICGNEEQLPEVYIPRSLSRTIINFKFVNEVKHNNLIFIKCKREDDLGNRIIDGKFVTNQLAYWEGQDIISNKNICICTEEFAEMSSKFPKANNYHLFNYVEENLEWIDSKGDVEELRSYRMTSTRISEPDLNSLNNFCNINIICAEPGIGKTTMLKFFHNSLEINYCPLYLNTKKWYPIISENLTVEEFVISFFNPSNTLEKSLIYTKCQRKEIVFLWDACDEALVHEQRQVIYKFVKRIQEGGYKQFLAARSNIRAELEEEFNSFARNIEKFDRHQQELYFESRLSEKYDKEKVSTIVQKHLETLKDNSILAVPLQLFMLTEILLQNDVDNLKLPLTTIKIYQHFVKGKFEAYFKKYTENEFIKKTITSVYMKKYKTLGVKICLESAASESPDVKNFYEKIAEDSAQAFTEPDPFGFVVNSRENESSFTHQTYAEYFAAQFISEELPLLKNFKDVYFGRGFNNVRFMMDLIFCKECPAHMAVLYKDLKALDQSKKEIFKKDAMERTAFHIAFAWTREHSLLPNIKFRIIPSKEEYANSLELIKYLLNHLAGNDEPYDELSELGCIRCLVHTAVRTGDLKIVKFIVEKYGLIDSRNEESETPLMFAAYMGNLEIVRYLTKKGANCNIANNNGWSPIWFAIRGGFVEIFNFLYESGANIETPDAAGDTVLSKEILRDNSEMIKCIMQKTAQMNILKTHEMKSEFSEGFVQRYVSRVIIDTEYLQNLENYEIVIISCLSTAEASIRGVAHFPDGESLLNKLQSTNIIKQKKVFGTTGEFTREQLRTFSNNIYYKVCHHLRYLGVVLEWIESRQYMSRLNIHNIERYQLDSENSVNADHLFQDLNSNVNIISGDGGSGKTTILKHLNCLAPPGTWTIYVNFREHLSKYSTNLEALDDVTDYLCQFLKKRRNFDQQLLKLFVVNRRIIFFWDGIEEVSNDLERENIYNFINEMHGFGFVHWIASRCILRSEIERRLGGFARSVIELSEREQREYLQLHLSGFDSDHVQIVSEKVTKNIHFLNNHQNLGTPLLLSIFKTLLLQHSEIHKELPLAITKLYDYFIKTKLESWLQNDRLTRESEKDRKEEHLEKYQLLAVQVCLEHHGLEECTFNFFDARECRIIERIKQESDPLGFIFHSNGTSTFIHKAFAEYFASLFLSKNYRRVPFFEQLYFTETFAHVRYSLDLILCENCPAHISVLCGDSENLEKYQTEILTRDSGGRNAVHLAAAWAAERFCLPDFQEPNNSTSPEHMSRNFEILISLLQYLKREGITSFNTVDRMFKMDCFSYAKGYLTHMTMASGDLALVKFIEGCTSVESKELCNYSPLMHAAFIGNAEFVEYFLQREDVNCRVANGSSAMYFCIYGQTNLPILQLLIEAGADLNQIKHQLYDGSWSGGTPLMHAARQGSLEVARCLIYNNAAVNFIGEYGRTALSLAAEFGHLDLVELLVQNQADVNQGDKTGSTPLMFAARQGRAEIVKYLIDNNAEIDSSREDGRTALIWAIEKSHTDVADILLKKNAQINSSGKDRTSPLISAAQQGNLTIVKYLIENGTDVNSPAYNGNTALIAAIQSENIEIVELLLRNKAAINWSNKDGWTPLMWAVSTKKIQIVKHLLENRVKVNLSANDGTTALIIAVQKGHYDIAAILLENNAQTNTPSANGWTPLMYAAKSGNVKIAKSLMDNKADVTLQENDGYTALHIAAGNNQIEIARFLVENKAQVDCSAENGSTPLTLAIERNSFEVARYLKGQQSENNH